MKDSIFYYIIVGVLSILISDFTSHFFTPKKTTDYQFNIIKNTDSLKMYDGDRFVGTAKWDEIDSLIVNDNK